MFNNDILCIIYRLEEYHKLRAIVSYRSNIENISFKKKKRKTGNLSLQSIELYVKVYSSN